VFSVVYVCPALFGCWFPSRLDFPVGSANSVGGLCAASGGGQLAGDGLEACDGVKGGYLLLLFCFPGCVSRRRIGEDRVGGVGRGEVEVWGGAD
jgi:hypothetical protein